ncbi:MAG TPA: gamma-glutamyl-gamma-aminobutyrate hydrolase family protein [Gemmatimonadales bacterium]
MIAVTCGHVISGDVPRARTNVAYLSAVLAAGGIPVIVPPFGEPDTARAAAAVLARVDGLLLTGGSDIDPALYGAARHPATGDPDAARDATEIALVHAARERRLPLLAICRGAQILNVAYGGTLVQDIPSECVDPLSHGRSDARAARCHQVAVVPESRLATTLGATALAVNSTHHQSAAAPGRGLRIVATAPDGVVEGLEPDDADWWALAVQWHPEELMGTEEPWDRALVGAFVREAARGA